MTRRQTVHTRPLMMVVPLVATILVEPIQAIGEPSSDASVVATADRSAQIVLRCSKHRSATDSPRWKTCRRGFVNKKSRLLMRIRCPTCNNDERQRHAPMTVFPEFATPADVSATTLCRA